MNSTLLLALISMIVSNTCNAFETTINLHEPAQQELFIEELTKQKIPHTLTSDGKIKYSSELEPKVSIIVGEIVTGDLPSENSLHYVSPHQRAEFIKRLKENNINYVVKIRHNEEWVVWDKTKTGKVNEIRKELTELSKIEFEKEYFKNKSNK